MQTKYKYKDKTYTHIYSLSEALGKEGIFIPLSISEDALKDLGVEVTHEDEPIEYLKERKIETLKMQRDKAEVEPIEYKGYLYDYDEKARDRINAAIIALDVQTAQAKATASIDWTTADNQDLKVTADDLRCVIAMVAQRSNTLHIAYREAKAKVEQATTVAEVKAITLQG